MKYLQEMNSGKFCFLEGWLLPFLFWVTFWWLLYVFYGYCMWKHTFDTDTGQKIIAKNSKKLLFIIDLLSAIYGRSSCKM